MSPWEVYLRRGGLRSGHREMRQSDRPLLPCASCYSSQERGTFFESYLRQKDHILAGFMVSQCRELRNETQSLKEIVNHLEKIHHAAVPFIEGLNMELLECQRQSVQ